MYKVKCIKSYTITGVVDSYFIKKGNYYTVIGEISSLYKVETENGKLLFPKSYFESIESIRKRNIKTLIELCK